MKFRDTIKETMTQLNALGFEALFPNIDSNPSSTSEDKLKFTKEHFKAIEESDAIYFILPSGYMGVSAKIELGYALALKKPVFFSELTNDVDLDPFLTKVISLDSLESFKEVA